MIHGTSEKFDGQDDEQTNEVAFYKLQASNSSVQSILTHFQKSVITLIHLDMNMHDQEELQVVSTSKLPGELKGLKNDIDMKNYHTAKGICGVDVDMLKQKERGWWRVFADTSVELEHLTRQEMVGLTKTIEKVITR